MDQIPLMELTRPATGERVRVIKSGADTGGEYVAGVSAFPPTLAESPLHEHPRQVERLDVVSGTLLVRMAGKQQVVGPGGSIVIPPGEAHEIANAGAETAQAVWQFFPALRTDAYLQSALDDPASGRVGRLRRVLNRLAVAAEFSDEYRRATLPWIMQRPVFALLRTVTGRSRRNGRRPGSKGQDAAPRLIGDRIGCAG